MEQLFEFDKDRNIVPTPYAMVYPCFSKLWSRDKSDNKSKAISEFGYVWYMCSQSITKNPYYERFVNDKEAKSKAIIGDLFEASWKPNKLVEDCIQMFIANSYKESADTRDALISVKSKLKSWFLGYEPAKDLDGLQLQRNTKSIQELTKAIKEYNLLVEQEEESNTNGITGGGEIGAFEE